MSSLPRARHAGEIGEPDLSVRGTSHDLRGQHFEKKREITKRTTRYTDPRVWNARAIEEPGQSTKG